MSSASRQGETILRRAVREQRRRNRFDDDAACEICGDTTLVHLSRVEGQTVCACCLALDHGFQVLEAHHIAGQRQGRTISACANCHRELTERQREWTDGLPFEERFECGLRDITALRELRRRSR